MEEEEESRLKPRTWEGKGGKFESFFGKKEKLDEARLFTFLIWAVISNGFAKNSYARLFIQLSQQFDYFL